MIQRLVALDFGAVILGAVYICLEDVRVNYGCRFALRSRFDPAD
jgi:hypothetical protein